MSELDLLIELTRQTHDRIVAIDEKLDGKADTEDVEKIEVRTAKLETNQTRILTGVSLAWAGLTTWLGFKD